MRGTKSDFLLTAQSTFKPGKTLGSCWTFALRRRSRSASSLVSGNSPLENLPVDPENSDDERTTRGVRHTTNKIDRGSFPDGFVSLGDCTPTPRGPSRVGRCGEFVEDIISSVHCPRKIQKSESKINARYIDYNKYSTAARSHRMRLVNHRARSPRADR